jgi:WD40 repeat protein
MNRYRTLAVVFCLGVLSARGLAQEPKKGNALPEGAIAQLGDTRFRNLAGNKPVLSPRLDVFGVGNPVLSELIDASTGRAVPQFAFLNSPQPNNFPGNGFGKKGFGTNVRYGPLVVAGFTPDGQRVLGMNGAKWALWEFATGKEIWNTTPLAPARTGLAISRDGTSFACVFKSAEKPDVVVVYDLANGQKLFQVTPAATSVQTVALSPDGKFLAVAGGLSTKQRLTNDPASPHISRIVQIWEVGQEDARIEVSPQSVYALEYSPDGKTLAIAAGDGLHIFDVADRKDVRLLGAAEGVSVKSSAQFLEFSKDGKQIAQLNPSLVSGEMRIWDIATGQGGEAFRLPLGRDSGVHFHDDPIVWGQRQSVLWIWNAATKKFLTPLDGNLGSVTLLRFTSDGQTLLTRAGSDPRVCHWSVSGTLSWHRVQVESASPVL